MSNLAQYIEDLRLYVGDLDGTEFSDSTMLTALRNAIKYLGIRWDSRYIIYSSGILVNPTQFSTPQGVCTLDAVYGEGDAMRNCFVTFTAGIPPIIQQSDVPAVLLAASYLLRRSKATSSVSGLSWSTPDLSYSNIESAKTYKELMAQDLAALDLFFKQKLGRIQTGRFRYQIEWFNELPAYEQAKWYYRVANQKLPGN